VENEGKRASVPVWVCFQRARQIGTGKIAAWFLGPGKSQGTLRDPVLPK
jgi:hypothetical protein